MSSGKWRPFCLGLNELRGLKHPVVTKLKYICRTRNSRNNERDGVSNYWRLDCLFNRLFRPRSKKTSKLRVTGLCEGNSPVTGEFPAQMASNAEIIPIWWRHHVKLITDIEKNVTSSKLLKKTSIGSNYISTKAPTLMNDNPLPPFVDAYEISRISIMHRE